MRASAVTVIQSTDNAVGGGIFAFLRRIVPDVTAGAGTFGVLAVASLADSAGISGAGAGVGEAVFSAKFLFIFRLGFETSPFVSKGTFDSRAAGARSFGIAQSGAILGCYALSIG